MYLGNGPNNNSCPARRLYFQKQSSSQRVMLSGHFVPVVPPSKSRVRSRDYFLVLEQSASGSLIGSKIDTTLARPR